MAKCFSQLGSVGLDDLRHGCNVVSSRRFRNRTSRHAWRICRQVFGPEASAALTTGSVDLQRCVRAQKAFDAYRGDKMIVTDTLNR